MKALEAAIAAEIKQLKDVKAFQPVWAKGIGGRNRIILLHIFLEENILVHRERDNIKAMLVTQGTYKDARSVGELTAKK